MENRVLQNLYILSELAPYQPDEHKQPLDVIHYGNSLLSTETTTDAPAQFATLLTSLTPLGVTSDNFATRIAQMVESSYYPQSTMTPLPDKIIRTLIAYADNEEDPRRKSPDKGYRNRISKILQMISTQICKLDCTWQEIAVEDQWKYEDHLERAHLILLLLDDNFVTTQYCFDPKLAYAVQRHRSRTAYVVPIYLRPCLLENVPFAKIPILPSKIQAISQHSNKDTAFDIIMRDISSMAKDIKDRILR